MVNVIFSHGMTLTIGTPEGQPWHSPLCQPLGWGGEGSGEGVVTAEREAQVHPATSWLPIVRLICWLLAVNDHILALLHPNFSSLSSQCHDF